MKRNLSSSRDNYFKIKLGLAGFLCSVFLIGCTQPGTLFNSAPLTPLVNARYTSDNAVKTLKKSISSESNDYIVGRNLYNRASSRVNGLLTQIIISVEANSSITNTKIFKDEIAAAVGDSVTFQNYVEEKTRPLGIADEGILKPIDIGVLLPEIIKGIANFSEAARAADAKQRAVMVCEIKSLLLPTFDEVNEKATYPNPQCSQLTEKLVLPSNPTPNKPSN
jgi:hypothetical protein